MKITLNWLKQHLQTTATLDEIVAKLTAIGLEVESVTDKSKELAAFRVAQILDAKQHPDADRLRVCRVNTGKEILQIVCGAPNARAGINVVLAPVGTIIPTNGMQIKASKIRGVESNGMLCSAAELGLSEDSEGIIELPVNDNLGQKFVDVAGLCDPLIEINITPNRGDCLGVYGIARDLAATGIGSLKPISVNEIKGSFISPIKVSIQNQDACPVFIGRYFKGVKNGQSPEWLQSQLKALGMKPISALVDITNYINLEYGRPLHVYDAKKLEGNLQVRFANQGEKFAGLDNKEYVLDSDLLVIADSKAPQALAGVIGGGLSGCTEETTDVFLEIALFSPEEVTKSGRRLDIITDSRYRFERKIDPAFISKGADFATKMILTICGGDVSEAVVAGEIPKWERNITLSKGFIQKYSGVEISDERAFGILRDLGFKVSGNVISVPSWRPDVEGEPDLVEEVLRIYGYDNIPMLLPEAKRDKGQGIKSPSPITYCLAYRGFSEVVTWSFMDRKKAASFANLKPRFLLQNPISSELDYMRPSIIPNLLDAVVKNVVRGFSNLALFEVGPVFVEAVPGGQVKNISGILSGEYTEKNVHGCMRNVDVFDAKAECLAALEAAGAPVASLQVERGAPSYYHPGKSGVLKLGKNILGVFGEIHPSILKKWDLKIPVMAFEVILDNIPGAKAKKSTARPKLERSEYQASTRDFAFIIDEKVPAADIIRAASGVDKQLIQNVDLFDVYQGKGIEPGKKSIAISARIQPTDRTLTDAELEGLSQKIIEAISQLGGSLRS